MIPVIPGPVRAAGPLLGIPDRLLLDFLQNPGRRGLLIGAALLAGLSTATRYSSIAFVGAGALGLLVLNGRRWRERLTQAATYLVVGILPVALWMVYDLSQTATLSSRSIETGMAQRVANLWPALSQVFMFWFIPDSWISNPPYPAFLNIALVCGALAALAAWVVWMLWAKKRSASGGINDRAGRMLVLLSLFMVAYLAVVALVYITTYPPITIGSRMLSPVHVTAIWLLVVLVGMSSIQLTRPAWLKGALVLALAVLTACMSGVRCHRQQNFELGLGYTSLALQHSGRLLPYSNCRRTR